MTVEVFVVSVLIDTLSDVVTTGLVVLVFVKRISYFVEVLSDVVERLAIGARVEVLAGVKTTLLAVVMTALELPMPIPYKEFSC